MFAERALQKIGGGAEVKVVVQLHLAMLVIG